MNAEDIEDELFATEAEITDLQQRVNILRVAIALMGRCDPAPVDRGGMFGLATPDPDPDPSYLDVERVGQLLALPQSATAASVLKISASVH